MTKRYRVPGYSPGVPFRFTDPFYQAMRQYRPLPRIRPYRLAPY